MCATLLIKNISVHYFKIKKFITLFSDKWHWMDVEIGMFNKCCDIKPSYTRWYEARSVDLAIETHSTNPLLHLHILHHGSASYNFPPYVSLRAFFSFEYLFTSVSCLDFKVIFKVILFSALSRNL